jgi:diaminohydroxyphosphoribosylaminopyrimidine deaminase/5-amino-6-(5-phosphoribosylamino)uracil reductase
MNNQFYMQLALNEAWKYQLMTYPNPAVGAVVVCGGEILSVEAHQRAGTSHAEVLALVRAYEEISGDEVKFDPMDAAAAHEFLRALPVGFFSECTIYVTLEPCAHEGRTPSCASLLEHLALEDVVIGMADPIPGHGGGAGRLDHVVMGVLEDACRDLIEPFLIWQDRAFVLFKIAQTQNGRIGGGIISSESSRRHVHRLRSVCDRLLIGGGTVRADRPILDSRMVHSRAPDVTIYSHQDEFDRDTPLFEVAGRMVEVSDDLSFLEQPSFVLVEGGGGMLAAIDERIDWLLTYTAPKLSSDPLSYNIDKILQPLHHTTCDVDAVEWSRYRGD